MSRLRSRAYSNTGPDTSALQSAAPAPTREVMISHVKVAVTGRTAISGDPTNARQQMAAIPVRRVRGEPGTSKLKSRNNAAAGRYGGGQFTLVAASRTSPARRRANGRRIVAALLPFVPRRRSGVTSATGSAARWAANDR